MKKTILFLSSFLILFASCNDESDSNLGKKNDNNERKRVVFKDAHEMDSTLSLLHTMDLQSQKLWSNSKLKKSYFKSYTVVDTTLLYQPNSLKAILNDDLEFCINDSIMWYNDNNIYYLSSLSSEENLEELKSKSELLSPYVKYEIVEYDMLPNTSRTVNLDTQDKGIANSVTLWNVAPSKEQTVELRSMFPTSNSIGLGELNVELKIVARYSTYSFLLNNAGHWAMDVYIVIVGSRKEFVSGVEKYVPLKDASFKTNISFSYFTQYTIYHGRERNLLSQGGVPSENKQIMNMFAESNIVGNQIFVFRCGELGKIQFIRNLFVSIMNGNVVLNLGEQIPMEFSRTGFNL